MIKKKICNATHRVAVREQDYIHVCVRQFPDTVFHKLPLEAKEAIIKALSGNPQFPEPRPSQSRHLQTILLDSAKYVLTPLSP